MTASPFEALARRTVLIAAESEQPVDNPVLADAVTEMLSTGPIDSCWKVLHPAA